MTPDTPTTLKDLAQQLLSGAINETDFAEKALPILKEIAMQTAKRQESLVGNQTDVLDQAEQE